MIFGALFSLGFVPLFRKPLREVERSGWRPLGLGALFIALQSFILVWALATFGDATAITDELEHVATLVPEEWLAPAATGSPDECAAAVAGQLRLGADAVIMHGASPADLAPIVQAYTASAAATA
jgi:hypothetical protein